ncbi:MAG: discoidin domain-containing protein [Akkermansia sp.]|nr:discoidin domain-containing protein [Akkermansia sp.]
MCKFRYLLAAGLLPLALAAGLSGCGSKSDDKAAIAKPKKAISLLPEKIRMMIRDGNYTNVEKALKTELKTLAQSKNPKTGLTAENPGALQMATVLEVIRSTSPQVMTKMCREGKGKFLEAFLNDQSWMELYLGAGMVPWHNDTGLGILAEIWEKDGKSGDFDAYKPLACALASVWGGGEGYTPPLQTRSRATHNPYWRYNFFKNRHQEGALHPGFEKLRPWELRFVVGIPQQDWDDQSYAWCAENINLPWNRYTSACWAAPYANINAFGNNVQTADYYVPWPAESDAQKTQLNGGVCGGLSHLGTVAAQAHGIPAFTVGQPGHCAYAIRLERGKWTGAYMGPDGGMHNWIFLRGSAPTSFRLMEEVFKDDASIERAYRQSFIARAHDAVGSPEARDAWAAAVAMAPLHPSFRQELQKRMASTGTTPQEWLDYATNMLKGYKGHGYAALDILKDVEEAIMPSMLDAQRRMWLAAEHRALAGTPGSWALKLGPVLQKQSSWFQSDGAKRSFLEDVLTIHMTEGQGAGLGQVIEWAVNEYAGKGKEKEALFEDAFRKAADAASSPGSGTPSANGTERADNLKKAYGKAIVAAEKAHSIPAFQTLTAAARQYLGLDSRPETLKERLPGTLVSDKGCIRFSSLAERWDSPETHGEILTRRGGKSHSQKEKSVEAVVTLERPVKLSGIIVRKADGNEQRMKKATLSISTDGATWFPLAETDHMPKVWVVEADPDTKAGYVKITFHNEGGGEFAHISHFLIYKR